MNPTGGGVGIATCTRQALGGEKVNPSILTE
jgi:hypothetical protein